MKLFYIDSNNIGKIVYNVQSTFDHQEKNRKKQSWQKNYQAIPCIKSKSTLYSNIIYRQFISLKTSTLIVQHPFKVQCCSQIILLTSDTV